MNKLGKLGKHASTVSFEDVDPTGGRVTAKKAERYDWAEIAGSRGKFRTISKKNLHIDQSYQRLQSVRRARKIAAAFDWGAFGNIIVSKRKIKGKWALYVIDGGHRVLGANMRPEIDMLPCLVFDGLTPDQEAEIFVLANTTPVKPTPADIFAARLRAGDKTAAALAGIFKQHGLTVERHGKKRGESSVKAIGTFYKMGSALACAVFDFCRDTFNGQVTPREWTTGWVAQGIVKFATLLNAQAGKLITDDDVQDKISRTALGALRARAMTLREVDPKRRRPDAFCRALVEAYNHGRHGDTYKLRAEV